MTVKTWDDMSDRMEVAANENNRRAFLMDVTIHVAAVVAGGIIAPAVAVLSLAIQTTLALRSSEDCIRGASTLPSEHVGEVSAEADEAARSTYQWISTRNRRRNLAAQGLIWATGLAAIGRFLEILP